MATKNIIFSSSYFTNDPFAVKNIRLTPQSPTPLISGSQVGSQDYIQESTDSNGNVLFPVQFPGLYTVQLRGPIKVTTFNILVPSNEGTFNANTLVTTLATLPFTGSILAITSSWALNVVGTNVQSASYATTASFALNGGGAGTTTVTGSLVPITSSQAISASFAGNYVKKTGDFLSGVIECVTGGEILFDNSSNGIVFAGNTADDFTLALSTGDLLQLTTRTGQIQFSQSRMIGTASIADTASFAVNSTNAQTASYISGSITFSATDNYVPRWLGNTLTATSSFIDSGSSATCSVALKANVVGSSSLNVKKTGDTFSGILEAVTGGQLLFDNSSNGMGFGGIITISQSANSLVIGDSGGSLSIQAGIITGSITTASYAGNYVRKTGDTFSGLLEAVTGGKLTFDNSSNGMNFGGIINVSQSANALVIGDSGGSLSIQAGIITGSITTASFALNAGSSGTTLFTGSLYQITSSAAVTSSWAMTATTAQKVKVPALNSTVYASSTSSVILDDGSQAVDKHGTTYRIVTANTQATAALARPGGISLACGAAGASGGSGFAISGSDIVLTSGDADSDGQTISAQGGNIVLQTGRGVFKGIGGNIYLKAASSAQVSNKATTGSVYISAAGVGINIPSGSVVNTLDVLGNISCSVVSASLQGTASWATNATTASFANASNATTLATGSVYPITSSWATTASFAIAGGSAGGGGTTLFTGSVYQITSSWANNAISASWAPGSTPGTTLFTGSVYQITSSWAINSTSGSVTSTSTNGVFYFDLSTGSSGIQPSYIGTGLTFNPGTNQLSGSQLGITASLQGSASFATAAYTSSYTSPYQSYTTVTTSSTNWITCSMDTPQQKVLINITASYSFTSSNNPASGQIADVLLHISSSCPTSNTSSLTFPSSWFWVNTTAPTSLTGSKEVFLGLHAEDNSNIYATWNPREV